MRLRQCPHIFQTLLSVESQERPSTGGTLVDPKCWIQAKLDLRMLQRRCSFRIIYFKNLPSYTCIYFSPTAQIASYQASVSTVLSVFQKVFCDFFYLNYNSFLFLSSKRRYFYYITAVTLCS